MIAVRRKTLGDEPQARVTPSDLTEVNTVLVYRDVISQSLHHQPHLRYPELFLTVTPSVTRLALPAAATAVGVVVILLPEPQLYQLPRMRHEKVFQWIPAILLQIQHLQVNE